MATLLSSIIRGARLSRGLTRAQLGSMCSPPRSEDAVRNLEHEERNLTEATVATIAEALGLSTRELLVEQLAVIPATETAPNPKSKDVPAKHFADVVRPLIEEGLSARDIAEKTGWNTGSIQKWIRRNPELRALKREKHQYRISPNTGKRHPPEWHAERVGRIARWLREGVALPEIASRLDVTAARVKQLIKRDDALSALYQSETVPVRWVHQHADQIAALLREGCGQAEIARRLGVSRERVRQIVAKDERLSGLRREVLGAERAESEREQEALAKRRNERVEWREDRAKQIADRLQSGMSFVEIGEELGVFYTVIAKATRGDQRLRAVYESATELRNKRSNEKRQRAMRSRQATNTNTTRSE